MYLLWQATNFLEGPNHFLNPSLTFGSAGHPFENLQQGHCLQRVGEGEVRTFYNPDESIPKFRVFPFLLKSFCTHPWH